MQQSEEANEDAQPIHLIKTESGWQLIDNDSSSAFASALLSNNAHSLAFLSSHNPHLINHQSSCLYWWSDPQLVRSASSSEQVETGET